LQLDSLRTHRTVVPLSLGPQGIIGHQPRVAVPMLQCGTSS